MKIIDSHMHCGVQNSELPYNLLKGYLDEGGIDGACLFAPVEDIYDRYNYRFEDTPLWAACRRRANKYLLDIQQSRDDIFAYHFVWNDFRKDELKDGFRGIKWHRHEDEPVYHYDDPLCEAYLNEAYRLALPVVLEESFDNTLCFIKRVAGRTPVIIPHMGMLNGGFHDLFDARIWDDETVFADTALAATYEIKMFLERYGSDRLLFGSDFPFGRPGQELRKIASMKLPERDYEKIAGANILRLTKACTPETS